MLGVFTSSSQYSRAEAPRSHKKKIKPLGKISYRHSSHLLRGMLSGWCYRDQSRRKLRGLAAKALSSFELVLGHHVAFFHDGEDHSEANTGAETFVSMTCSQASREAIVSLEARYGPW